MIFCRELLFVHVPKTGGMSVSKCLLNVLSPPVYYSRPAGSARTNLPGIVEIPGIRHESLAEAKEVVARHGFELARFPLIVAAIRNPYALEVSRYAYLQIGNIWDKGHNQDRALTANFETFAVTSHDHGGRTRPLQSYFEIEGHMPANLRILRCENLEDDLRSSAPRRRGLSSRLP